MEISIISTSQHLEVVLDILQDMVKNPVFAEEEVEKEKKYAISQMKKSEDDTFTFAYNLFKKKLYEPFQHPYAYPTLGDEEVVKSITRDEIVAHWRKFYVPQRMVLVIVSDQKDEILKRKIEEKFGSLPKGKERIECRPYSFPSLNLKPQTEEVRKDISQVFIILGYPGANVSSSEYPVFKVINTILGSGMSSKLFKELREKKKLAYSVGSFYPTRLNYSHFITYIIASEYHQDLAFNGLLEEIRKIKEGEIHPDELTRAKKYLIGSFLRKHERKSKQAWYLGWFETIGVGYEFDQKYPQLIKEVTKEQIQKVAQKYFNLYTAVIVKPTEKREKEK
jgi:predicted Zn-dependent peptidase